MWTQSLEKDIGRNLEDDIWDEEYCQRRVVLHSPEVEVRCQAEQLGIGDVDTVEESQEIEDTEKGNHSEVDLRNKTPLRCVRRADYMEFVVDGFRPRVRRRRRIIVAVAFHTGFVVKLRGRCRL